MISLLDLPPEIRERIYILICASPNPYIVLHSATAHVSFPLNLLLTNTQIYHELRPLYFSSNSFSIALNRRNESWDYFLSPSWTDNRRQIRSLRLNIIRWGSKDFFRQRLIPLLEDCILNGKLRNLEVRTRESWMSGFSVEWAELGKEKGGEGTGNWRCLNRILRDPYLDRGVILVGPLDEGYKRDNEAGSGEIDEVPFPHVTWLFDQSGQSVGADGRWQKIE